MGKRSKGREYALLSLFPTFVSECDQGESLDYLVEERKPSQEVQDFCKELSEGVLEHLESLDGLIRESLENWDFDRIGNLEKTVLRIAAFELKYRLATPTTVILKEAANLAQTYANEDSARFVNGLLDRMANACRPEE